MARFLHILAWIGVLGAGFTTNGPSYAQENTPIYFEESACWFSTPRDFDITCGHLNTPERHGDAESRRLRLPVLILNGHLKDVHPPLLYIEGGPGSDAGVMHRRAGHNWRDVIYETPFMQGRTIIVMAQRGTADETSMELKCPTLGDPRIRIGLSTVPRLFFDATEAAHEALSVCKQNALDAGYDLRAYSTINAVKDLMALRQALQITKWDIFANSYGSRVAVVLAGQDPQGASAMVLDGPDLPDSYASFRVGHWLDTALTRMQADCNKIERCKSRFPELATYAQNVAARLKDNSEWVGFRRGDDNQILYIQLTQERALNTLYNAFYSEQAIKLLPRALYRAAREDYSVFGALSGSLLLDPFHELRSYGMSFSVDCGDFSWSKAAKILRREKRLYPAYAPMIDARLDSLENLCPLWLGKDFRAGDLAVAEISTPILFLTGVYDPVTPLDTVSESGIRFPNAQTAAFPAMGHGVTFTHPCAGEIADNFLQAPMTKIDTSCLDTARQVPDFNLDRSPPPAEPFIEMKSYGDSRDRRSK